MLKVSSETDDLKNTAAWQSAPASAEKLQRLEQLANLGVLSAGLAHEIKNGLQAVQTFVDLLLEKNQDAELGDIVRRELRRISGIVSQMLQLGAPSPASFKTVRVHEVLDHSLRLLQPHITIKLITVEKEYHAESDAVHGDDAQLQQTFMNLLLNAVEAMGPNGMLTISTETTGNESGARLLQIQIQDTGRGIAPENLARLFEPFFTTKKNGTGLGLAISHRIVREHQGSIQAHSEHGRSTTFSILLPVSPVKDTSQ